MDSSYTTSSYSPSSAMTPAESAVFGAVGVVYFAAMVVVTVISIVSMWRLFTKAGKPGWASIVPIYNTIVQLQIAGRPAWWVLLILFVPLLNVWVSVVALIDFVRSYQRSGLWVLGLMFLPVIALPWFTFSSKTQYRGPIAAGRTDFMPAPVPMGSAPTQPVYTAPIAQSTAPVQPVNDQTPPQL